MNSILLETIKGIYLKTGNPGFIPVQAYEDLVNSGELDKDEYLDEKVIDDTLNRLHREASNRGTIGLKEFATQRTLPSFEATMDKECKKQAVANYFWTENQIDNF